MDGSGRTKKKKKNPNQQGFYVLLAALEVGREALRSKVQSGGKRYERLRSVEEQGSPCCLSWTLTSPEDVNVGLASG